LASIIILSETITLLTFYYRFILFTLGLLLSSGLSAQTEEQDTTSQDRLVVKFAETRITDLSGEEPEQIFYGDVRLYKDSIFMFCDTARVIGNDLRAKGNVIIIQSDTIRVFADSLYYDGDSLLAYLYDDVVLENGDKKLYTDILIYDTETKIASYQDTALMVQEESSIQSVRGYYNVDASQAFFYDDVYIESTDMQMRADSMSYLTEAQRTIFMGPTRIKQIDRDIYCESGFYDMDDRVALFEQNAQFQEPDSQANAQSIRYEGNTGEIQLQGDAYYRNKKDIGTGETIIYNEQSETALLRGNATFENETSKVEGDRIDYDKASESFKVKGTSIISDPPYIIEAESVDYDKATNTALADGMVTWQDTSAGISIICDHLTYREETGYVTATNDTGHPLMKNVSGVDTLYMSAVKLNAFDEYQTDSLGVIDTIKYFIADEDVKILKSNLQAICDSLIYQSKDSLFLLLQDPVVWSDSSQIVGDTVEIYFKNEDIDRMEVFPKSFLANTQDLIYYNQISGKRMTTLFDDGKLSTLTVKGNARSLYYMVDELEAYVGVNSTECSKIRFSFDEKTIKSIRFFTQPRSVILPMRGTNHEDIKLEGFNWRFAERPQTLEDLLSNLTKNNILK